MNPKPTIVVCFAACVLAGGWFIWMLARAAQQLENSKIVERQAYAIEEQQRLQSARPAPHGRASDAEVATLISGEARSKIADALIERLLRAMLANKRAAIDREAILTFADEAAYQHFVESIQASEPDIDLLGMLDVLRAVRLGYRDLESLRALLDELDDGGLDIAANYRVRIPIYPIPDPDAPLPGASGGAPFRSGALRFLGIGRGENAGWGEGITIAVLDSGVAEHPTFREGQVRQVGDPVAPPISEPGENSVVDGHGTAVASIIAGNDPRTPGVAPQAEILSFRLLDASGSSDSFTLAQMISSAAALGAHIINLSVGSYGDSQIVHDMVDLALENQVLIVASGGNDASGEIVFPAAYEGVIAVAAIDAQGEHLEFSNSSELIDLAAPGLAVDAAWPNGQMVEFSGTSASAPFVTGALAAVMSENPELTTQQAWSLLQQFANEAGAPGSDPQFGRGNLNLGRLMERDQAGIFDLAIASHYLAPATTTSAGAGKSVQVTVQNRGTETLANLVLNVDSSGSQREFFIPLIRPGQIDTRSVPLNLLRAGADGHVSIASRAALPATTPDRSPADNLLQTFIKLDEAETAAK